ncbi:GSCOCT00002984001.2-RA-CDS, partial [Cotesia congregata]
MDVQHAIKYTQWFMELLAIPHRYKRKFSTKKKLSSAVGLFVINVLIVWNISFRSIDMFTVVRDFDEKILLFAPWSFSVVINIKYMFMIFRGNDIMMIIEHIKIDWIEKKSPEEELIMVRNSQLCNRITLCFMVLMYVSGALYNFVIPFVLPILLHSKSNTSDRTPIFDGYDVFFNAQVSPIYEITFFFQVYVVTIGFSILIFMCHLTVVSVTHACGQIQIINYLIRYLIDDIIDINNIQNKISIIISRHIRVLSFVENVQKILLELCLLEMGASTVLICIDEYCFLKMLETNDIANMIPFGMLFVCLNFNILVLCYFSELLNSQFIEIGTESSMTEWYRFPQKIKSYLILIICMSQRSQKLTAGGIIDLSYGTYIQILKTGFTYFQMLRA